MTYDSTRKRGLKVFNIAVCSEFDNYKIYNIYYHVRKLLLECSYLPIGIFFSN